MIAIPSFEEAFKNFGLFVAAQGFSTDLVWIFRDDIWHRNQQRLLVRWPLPPGGQALAEKVFGEGRARGIVEITAIAQMPDRILATVWYPKSPKDEIQGWSEGLKLSIVQPLPSARRIPSLLWPAIRWTSTYKQYQERECFVLTRKWGAEKIWKN